MKPVLTAKAGAFLVGFCVLTTWLLLVARPGVAHEANSVQAPNCSSLPDDAFFTAENTIQGIDATDTRGLAAPTKQGEGGDKGNTNYRYTKITIPAIAAGELRVFHNMPSTADASAATLCRGSTRIADDNPRYDSDHTTHETFKIRAQVSPGDEEYIVVIDSDAPGANLTIQVVFHGAIYHDDGDNPHNDELTGSFTNRGQRYGYDLKVTTNGLLTVQTTGSTDTKGELFMDSTSLATAETGGSGGNFQMVVPVIGADDPNQDGEYTVYVDGQTLDTRGTYTLDIDFEVAMATIGWSEFTAPLIHDRLLLLPSSLPMLDGVSQPDWADAVFAEDDSVLQLERGDEDYIFFSPTANVEFLSIETQKAPGEDDETDTTGTLFGPTGEVATATSGGGGTNFRIEAPVAGPGVVSYVVKVEGRSSSTEGPYELQFASQTTTQTSLPSTKPDTPGTLDCSANKEYQICAPGGSATELETDYYALDIENSGTLYVHTTGGVDTVGVLYGPDGDEIVDDDDSGKDENFRIAVNVEPGLHLVAVQGKSRETQGVYGLVVNFLEGEEVEPPTTPPDDDDGGTPVQTDATGHLEEPPNGGVRSGIGTIRGWACQAGSDGVEIRIMNTDGDRVATIDAPYGSDRGDVDVDAECDRRDNDVGFAVQYNYNLLPAGTYTIEAWVGRDQVGLGGAQTNTFRVVRISSQEFLIRLQSGRVQVEDFPFTGDTTILEWDQASQNFQIVDVE